MPIPLFIVDAFTAVAFSGNPAAVCFREEEAEASWMQRVAAEMNLSETAFLTKRDDGFGLRWFTPTVEVDLCGHATLASAHVLFETGRLSESDTARFHTSVGLLEAYKKGDGAIVMDFPAMPPSETTAPPGLAEALGIDPVWTGRSRYDLLVVAANEAEVRRVKPEIAAMMRLDCRGVIVTAQGPPGAGYDFVSRFFAPAAGVEEDPVTGSAHCALAPFWASRLGKTDLMGFQASARGGVIGVRVIDDRVELSGRAVTVLRGEWVAVPG